MAPSCRALIKGWDMKASGDEKIMDTNRMKEFVASDGRTIKVVEGFKARILDRPSANPKADWDEAAYGRGTDTKYERWRSRLSKLRSFGLKLESARVLDIACGNGIDCLLLGLEPVRAVVGIDLNLSLFQSGHKGERNRRLASKVMQKAGLDGGIEKALQKLPVTFMEASAKDIPFSENYFDLIISKSFLEHISPLEKVLAEMERVLSPGGMMFHVIDPFYWFRGCHSVGLVDIPWAHARLAREDYHRFVAETEGVRIAEKRCRSLDELNHYTPSQYREIFEKSSLEIVLWEERPSTLAVELLESYQDVLVTADSKLTREDLLCHQIRVLVRKRT
jgi:SAM-dependent methyltransferase